MRKTFLKIYRVATDWRLLLLAGLIVGGSVIINYAGGLRHDKMIETAQASYASVTISNTAATEIKAYCNEDSADDICKKDYPAKIIAETYGILKKDIYDFGNATKINKITLRGEDEIDKVCMGPSLGCFNRDTRDIDYVWSNFALPAEESYHTTAHEMLHAYAHSLGFDVYPFEEGIVDDLAITLPGIGLSGEQDISQTGAWSYIEMRNLADKLIEIYKLKGKGQTQNTILANILHGGSSELKGIMGEMEFTTMMNMDTALYKKNGTVHCKVTEIKPTKRSGLAEFKDRTFCLYYDETNYATFYQSALDLLEKVKANITKTASANPTQTSKFETTVFPELLQEDQKINVKYTVSSPKANSVFVAVTRPSPTTKFSKDNICKLINASNALSSANGFSGVEYRACTNGSCQDTFSYTLPKTELKNDYKIKVLSFTTSDSGGQQNCNGQNIIELKEQSLTVTKGTTNTGTASSSASGIKGKVRVNAPTLIGKGDAVMVNVAMEDHQNDEFMLWITDCDGTLVPKILASDHKTRTVPSNSYTYPYKWDTKAAQTKSCKHQVLVKVFDKNGTWNDQAKYEITVSDSKVEAKVVCLMQFDEFVAKQNAATASEDNETDQDTTSANNDLSGNNDTEKKALEDAYGTDNSQAESNNDTSDATDTSQNGSATVSDGTVTLNWNNVCDAQKYIIYRNEVIIGETSETTYTDTVPETGNYNYKIEAYLDASQAPAVPNYQDSDTEDSSSNSEIFDQTSWNRVLDGLKAAFLPKAKAASAASGGQTPAASKTAAATKSAARKPAATSKTVTVNIAEIRAPQTGSNEPVTSSDLTTGSGNPNCSGIKLGLPIPEYENGSFSLKYCADNIADYMTALYKILIVIAVLSATIMVIYGGYMYIMSAGDTQKVSTAKEIILGAIVGLLLLLGAGVIITTIGVNK